MIIHIENKTKKMTATGMTAIFFYEKNYYEKLIKRLRLEVYI